MSELHMLPAETTRSPEHPPLWPVAAVILLVVFVPSLIAFGMALLRP